MERWLLIYLILFLITSSLYCCCAELDPSQLIILRSSFNLSAGIDPCTDHPHHHLPSSIAVVCDSDEPFRHLISLRITNCTHYVPAAVDQEITTLTEVSLVNCPIPNFQWPSILPANLRSFTAVNSLRMVDADWLGQLRNLNVLIVSGVEGNNYMLREIGNMTKIETLIISNANVSGFLPNNWPMNLRFIDLSLNSIQGKIPKSISSLQSLQYLNLSGNSLHDSIPHWIGDMVNLKNLSLAWNFLSGTIPESMAAMKSLVHLDLSHNRLTGPIPDFFAHLIELKYLNLEGNFFDKELPFNKSFVSRLEVFRIGGNQKLCYDKDKLPHADFGKVQTCYDPGPTGLVTGVGYVLILVFVFVFILVMIAKYCK